MVPRQFDTPFDGRKGLYAGVCCFSGGNGCSIVQSTGIETRRSPESLAHGACALILGRLRSSP